MTAPPRDVAAIQPIALRQLTLENNLVLAPMAGVSNLPFRLIAREAGAALAFSETVSARGLLHGGGRTRRLLRSEPRERPVAFQLFGSEPRILGEACRWLEDAGAVWVDLNAGCPARKFVGNGAGAALLRDLPRAAAVVRAMREGFSGTLSVKMRTGWNGESIVAPELARIAVLEGAELLSVHGRTRAQQFAGEADRQIIRQVVEAVPGTPVLANGDVVEAQQVFAMLRETGAAGVMIGRGAMGNPWIFEQALALARHGTLRRPTPEERFATIERHAALMETGFPDRRSFTANFKKYIAAYSRELPGSAAFRREALRTRDLDVILELAREFFAGRRWAT